jgi:hypothetical protein
LEKPIDVPDSEAPIMPKPPSKVNVKIPAQVHHKSYAIYFFVVYKV